MTSVFNYLIGFAEGEYVMIELDEVFILSYCFFSFLFSCSLIFYFTAQDARVEQSGPGPSLHMGPTAILDEYVS